MSLFAAWVAYPAVLLVLCAGLGLLVDALAGRRLCGVLIVPTGFAAVVVAGQFVTWSDATAELTVPVIAFLAALGAMLAVPWRFGRLDPIPGAVALAVFAVFAVPVVLTGEPTFAGFIKLDDTATWFTLTDRVMEHGRSLEGLGPSTYRATLDFNLAGGYPVGVFIPFGAAQKLVGGDLAWVFAPYLSFLAAVLALSLWRVLEGIVERPGMRALAVFVASQPALLFGYALWGGVKELGATATFALVAALAPAVLRAGSDLRDAALLALPAAALVGVLSMGGLVWVGPLLLVLTMVLWRRDGLRPTAARALAFALLLAVLVLPVVSSGLVPPTSSPLTDPNAEGNLRGPLNALQVLGVWPSGDFRFDPDGTIVTAVLIGLGIAAALAGLWVAWARRRAGAAVALYATALIACAAIVLIGSPWAGAKALATASPVALALAMVGALAALRVDRLAGSALLAAVAVGVLWSNVLAFGGASLAPYEQLRELERIGEQFAGEGPALMTEYNPYGARHFLRELDGEAASELRERTVPLRGGGTVEKGFDVDVDELDLDGLFVYRTLVLRRSPLRSRPPSPYRLAWSGDYYEVWQRPAAYVGLPPEHLPLGEPPEVAAVPNCAEVRELAGAAAGDDGERRLLAAGHPPYYDATDGSFEVSGDGLYHAWLKGSARGRIELTIDGREVGEIRHELNNEGGYIDLGQVRLSAGPHEAKLSFGGADLHPGSGGFPRPRTGPLLISPADGERGALTSIPAGEAERLCGRAWDWVEAVG